MVTYIVIIFTDPNNYTRTDELSDLDKETFQKSKVSNEDIYFWKHHFLYIKKGSFDINMFKPLIKNEKYLFKE